VRKHKKVKRAFEYKGKPPDRGGRSDLHDLGGPGYFTDVGDVMRILSVVVVEIERMAVQCYKVVALVLGMFLLGILSLLAYKYPMTWGLGFLKWAGVIYFSVAWVRLSYWAYQTAQLLRQYYPAYQRMNKRHLVRVRWCLRGQKCSYPGPKFWHKLRNHVVWFLGIHLRLPLLSIWAFILVVKPQVVPSLFWPWIRVEQSDSQPASTSK
jgi:hypothetical protein